MKTFGAIYIGTSEMSLRIYEISRKKQYKDLDFVKVRTDMEKDILRNGSVAEETIRKISETLLRFSEVLDTYAVKAYEVYITPSIRNASNRLFFIEHIKLTTGMELKELSNSEQKFFDILVFGERPEYEKMSKEGIIVVDVGGSSMQLSLINNGEFVTTQHVPFSPVRIREQLRRFDLTSGDRKAQIHEMINKEVSIFLDMYREYAKVSHLIIIGDYISDAIRKAEKKNNDRAMDRDYTLSLMNKIIESGNIRISGEHEDYSNFDSLSQAYFMVYYGIIESITTDDVWILGTTTHEGIFLNYCYNNKLLKPTHDFEKDVISACRYQAARYRNAPAHDEALKKTAFCIFDAMKKLHGLGKRDRLLLEVAIMLHDCGRYVSLDRRAICSYEIIISQEIIGLSHLERKIVAYVARFNRDELPPLDELLNLTAEAYVRIAKLSAIIKLAAALDSTGTQKVRDISCTIKNDSLIVSVDSAEDLTAEHIDFDTRAELFGRIFNLKPVLRERRVIG